MSTDDSQPTSAAPTAAQPAPGDPGDPGELNAPGAPHPAGPEGPGGLADETDPGWFDRNATLVISVSVAVIAVAAALVTLFFYRESVDDKSSDTEAAVREFVEGQGGKVESVECDEGTCAAVVSGTAYTVLVQEDEDGDQHFGITAYIGD